MENKNDYQAGWDEDSDGLWFDPEDEDDGDEDGSEGEDEYYSDIDVYCADE